MKLEIDNVRLRKTQQEWVLELVFPQEASDLAAYYISRIGKHVDVTVDEKVVVDVPEGELEEENPAPSYKYNSNPHLSAQPVAVHAGGATSVMNTDQEENSDPLELKQIDSACNPVNTFNPLLARLHVLLGTSKDLFKEFFGIQSFKDLSQELLQLCIDRIEFKDTPDDARHVSEEKLKQSIIKHYETLS